MSSPRYSASINHTERTIDKLYKTRRRAYEKPRIFLRLALGFILVLTVVMIPMATWLKAVLLLIGAWLMASGDFPAQTRADRVVQERKGLLPVMRYEFFDDHLKLTGEGSMTIGYQKIDRLVEDKEYFYLFLSKDSVCMLSRDSLKPPAQDDFRQFLENRTGRSWRTEKSFLSLDLADLIKMHREKKKS